LLVKSRPYFKDGFFCFTKLAIYHPQVKQRFMIFDQNKKGTEASPYLFWIKQKEKN
jgi:hypothetical protein